MSICQELEELIPAYVLDAVSEQDRAHIEAHLPRCANCAQSVAAYRPVADLLPFAVPMVEPSAGLRDRVLAATMPKAQSTRAIAPSFVTQLTSVFSALFRSPAFSAGALGLVCAMAIWNISLQNQLSTQTAADRQRIAELTQQREFATLVTNVGVQPKRLQGTEVSTRSWGRLYDTTDQTTLALVAYDLPALQPDKVYQFWLIDPNGDRTSGGTFTVDEQGRGLLLIRSPKPLNQYQGVGITVEPAGGSPKPTGPKMMGTSL